MEAGSSIFFWFGKIPIYRIKRKHRETRRERTPQPLKSPGAPAEIYMEQRTGDEEPNTAASLENELREDEEEK